MANRKIFRTNRLSSVAMCLSLLAVVLFGIGCSPYTCDFFNCDTLFFIEDIIDALDNQSHDDDHADNDTGDDDDHADNDTDHADNDTADDDDHADNDTADDDDHADNDTDHDE